MITRSGFFKRAWLVVAVAFVPVKVKADVFVAEEFDGSRWVEEEKYLKAVEHCQYLDDERLKQQLRASDVEYRVENFERVQTQLAGCLMAAEGSREALSLKSDAYGWSLALQRIQELQEELRVAKGYLQSFEVLVNSGLMNAKVKLPGFGLPKA